MKFHGSKIKKCPDHGEFKASVINFVGNRPCFSGCPQCGAIRAAQIAEDEREEQLQLKIRKYTSAGVSKRFLKASFTNYDLSVSKKAVSNCNAVRGYFEDFKNAHEIGACFIMCGKPGTGKTHLASALTKALVDSGKSVVFATSYRIMARIKATYDKLNRKESEAAVIKNLTTCDLLIVDEVGVQFGTNTERTLFYQIVNGRYDNMLPTVLLSNLDKNQLKQFIGERCFDRFQENGGVILAFDWGSYRK